MTRPSSPWWRWPSGGAQQNPWGFVWRSALAFAVLWIAFWSLLGALRAAFGSPPTGWPTLERPASIAVWIGAHAVSGLLTGALWALIMWKLRPREP